MKKILIIMACLLTMQITAEASNDKAISFEKLPQQSQQLIKEHFADQAIALVKMDTDIFDTMYEVIFTNGNKIEFDRKGVWQEIQCKNTQFPEQLIPQPIKEYVNKNYSGIKIVKLEKEDLSRHEVDLANGINLEFDSNFNIIDIDF
ncbi:MAG: PepSY-like domain-containing protein [Lentimicrobiaceae bacterium]|jgi:hypothetical protein|nr:PepSY-like domain-containing protein [Lentimicrobiaceae bacterium]